MVARIEAALPPTPPPPRVRGLCDKRVHRPLSVCPPAAVFYPASWEPYCIVTLHRLDSTQAEIAEERDEDNDDLVDDGDGEDSELKSKPCEEEGESTAAAVASAVVGGGGTEEAPR